MSFIRTIDESEATGELAELYAKFSGPDGSVDNVLKVHSLNPASMAAHCELYVQAMKTQSPVSRAEREMIGVVVSRANGCAYCLSHHTKGLKGLLSSDRKPLAKELASGDDSSLNERERAMTGYAFKLTREPDCITQNDTDAMRTAGLDDREMLDVAQAAAYFAYANRIVLGLGVSLES